MRSRRPRRPAGACWGEYLDDEWYYVPAPPPPPRPEPWRRHRLAGQVFLMSREMVSELAQPERLREIASDRERLAWLRGLLLANGLERPLEVTVDGRGHIVLGNGHHRLLCTEGLEGWDTFPVVFLPSDGIRVPSRELMHVLDRLLRQTKVSS